MRYWLLKVSLLRGDFVCDVTPASSCRAEHEILKLDPHFHQLLVDTNYVPHPPVLLDASLYWWHVEEDPLISLRIHVMNNTCKRSFAVLMMEDTRLAAAANAHGVCDAFFSACTILCCIPIFRLSEWCWKTGFITAIKAEKQQPTTNCCTPHRKRCCWNGLIILLHSPAAIPNHAQSLHGPASLFSLWISTI